MYLNCKQIYDEVGMKALRQRSKMLTGYLEALLDRNCNTSMQNKLFCFYAYLVLKYLCKINKGICQLNI